MKDANSHEAKTNLLLSIIRAIFFFVIQKRK